MPLDPSPATFVGTVITAVRSFNQRRISDTLDEAAVLLGLDLAVDDVVLASLRVVDSFCSFGTMDLSHAHAFTNTVRHWIASEIARQHPATRQGRILLAAGPDDPDTTFLDCLDLLLASRGVEVVNLGAHTPVTAAVFAADTVQPRAVVVISNTPTTATAAVRSVAALTEAGRPVYYAGTSFTSSYTGLVTPGLVLDVPLALAARLLTHRHTTPNGPPDNQQPDRSRDRATV